MCYKIEIVWRGIFWFLAIVLKIAWRHSIKFRGTAVHVHLNLKCKACYISSHKFMFWNNFPVMVIDPTAAME